MVFKIKETGGAPVGMSDYSKNNISNFLPKEFPFQEEDLLRAITEVTTDHIYVKNIDGKFIMINSSAASFLGKLPKEIIGRGDSDFFPPDLVKKIRDHDLQILKLEEAQTYEESVAVSGFTRTFLSMKAPYRGRNKKIIGIIGISRDITERKILEEKLRTEHAFRKPIEDSILAGISAVNLEGRMIYVNPAFCKLVGWSEEELIGSKLPFVFWPPEELENIQNSFKERLEGNSLHSVELRLCRRNGARFHVLVSTAPLTDGYGNKIGVVSSITDITNQKLAEIKFHESYNLLRSILEGTTDSVYVRDLEGRYLMINSTAARFLGKSEEELIGKGPTGSVSPQSIQKFRENDQKVLESGKTETFEVKLTFNGTDRTFLTTKGPVRNHHGNVFGIFGISRDITDRKAAEEKLKGEFAFRRAVEESLNSGICAADSDGKIIYANPAFSKMVGWSEEELLGTMLPHCFWPPEETEKIMNTFQKGLNKSGPPGSDELIFRRKNEERFPVLVFPSPLMDENGNIFGLLASFIDISEKKKIEEELGKVEKLKLLGLLAGGIAHDFNNILTAILGNLSLAMMELDPNIPASLYLKETEQASLKAKTLASQLLSFTKGGAPQKQFISIIDLIKDSTTFVMRGSSISSEFYFSDNLWTVKVDPGQISQVIHNLVINSQQAMIEGGRIVISAENVMIDEPSAQNLLLNPGPFVVISFKDNGKGIPRNLIDKIFDPFFTTKEQGSGLGLFSAYSIVKNHSGAIKVESRVGIGTTFFIFLPGVFDNKVPDDKKNDAILYGSGRILLMDDDEMVRTMASAMIQKLGYKVEVATKGEEALEMYRKAKERNQPFHAVILDLTIPGGKGGKQTIQELLAYDPNIQAIVSSGYSTDPIIDNYQEYGFQGCVPKPYRMQDLSKTLSQILKKE
ncbi:MAG: PAS domain S-box protein [Nitrospiria bacterium]